MSTDPAVQAAAEAIGLRSKAQGWDDWTGGQEAVDWTFADLAVAAARPIIEAEVRERIAAAIEAAESTLFGGPDDPYQRGWSQMRGKAAHIAREES